MKHFRIDLTRWECGLSLPVHSFILTAISYGQALSIVNSAYPNLNSTITEITSHEEPDHAEGSPRLSQLRAIQ